MFSLQVLWFCLCWALVREFRSSTPLRMGASPSASCVENGISLHASGRAFRTVIRGGLVQSGWTFILAASCFAARFGFWPGGGSAWGWRKLWERVADLGLLAPEASCLAAGCGCLVVFGVLTPGVPPPSRLSRLRVHRCRWGRCCWVRRGVPWWRPPPRAHPG